MCGDSADAPGQPPPLRSAFAPADRLAPPKPAIPPRDDAPPFRHPFDSVPNLSPCFRHALVTPLCHAAGRRAGFRPENGHEAAFWHGSAPSGARPELATWPFAGSALRRGSRTPSFRARTRFRGHFRTEILHGDPRRDKNATKERDKRTGILSRGGVGSGLTGLRRCGWRSKDDLGGRGRCGDASSAKEKSRRRPKKFRPRPGG